MDRNRQHPKLISSAVCYADCRKVAGASNWAYRIPFGRIRYAATVISRTEQSVPHYYIPGSLLVLQADMSDAQVII